MMNLVQLSPSLFFIDYAWYILLLWSCQQLTYLVHLLCSHKTVTDDLVELTFYIRLLTSSSLHKYRNSFGQTDSHFFQISKLFFATLRPNWPTQLSPTQLQLRSVGHLWNRDYLPYPSVHLLAGPIISLDVHCKTLELSPKLFNRVHQIHRH